MFHSFIQGKDRRRCAPIEQLESRGLFTANHWINASGGDWSVDANWSLGHVPTASEDAVIDLPGSYTVTHTVNVTDSAASITTAAPLTISGGALATTGTLLSTATLTLAGGSIVGAT